MPEGNGDLQFALGHPVRGAVVENERGVAFTVNRQWHGHETANALGSVFVAAVFEDRGEIGIVDDKGRGKRQGRSLEHVAGKRSVSPTLCTIRHSPRAAFSAQIAIASASETCCARSQIARRTDPVRTAASRCSAPPVSATRRARSWTLSESASASGLWCHTRDPVRRTTGW